MATLLHESDYSHGNYTCSLLFKKEFKRNSVNNIRKWHEYDMHNLQSVITKSNRRPDHVAKNQFPFFKIRRQESTQYINN